MKLVWLSVCVVFVCAQQQPNASQTAVPFCIGKSGDFFQCADGKKCVNRKVVCDNHQDCDDNSDESGCRCTKNSECKSIGARCSKRYDLARSRCCTPDKVFTGDQCEDKDECRNATICQGKGTCVNRDNGFECIECPAGYEAKMRDWRILASIGNGSENDLFRKLLLCDDHNECAEDTDHCREDGFCVNRIGDFSCQCPPNHERTENKCKANGEEPVLVFSEKDRIRVFDLRSAIETFNITINQTVVDVAGTYDRFFYATARQIHEVKLMSRSNQVVVDLTEALEFSDIKKIVSDWENQRIYFITGDTISVTNYFGQTAKLIEHRGNISSIAVDPTRGYLFYSEFGQVKRVHLDGAPGSVDIIFRALSSERIAPIDALSIDPNLNYVYYLYDRILYSFDYQGHLAVIISTTAQYSTVEPFEDLLYSLYRSDARGIVMLKRPGYTVGKVDGKDIVSFQQFQPTAMAILQSSMFPRQNKRCHNHSCSSDWCFMTPSSLPNSDLSKRCICSDKTNRTCIDLRIFNLGPTIEVIDNSLVSAGFSHSARVPIHSLIGHAIIPIVWLLAYRRLNR